jgi:hypothetical protein
MLKGRFPWLRSIRHSINEDKASIRRVLQLIDATIILHNMLIEFGEEDEEEWIDWEDFSEIWARCPYETGDRLNEQVPEWAPKDHRRSSVLSYLTEFFSFL